MNENQSEKSMIKALRKIKQMIFLNEEEKYKKNQSEKQMKR